MLLRSLLTRIAVACASGCCDPCHMCLLMEGPMSASVPADLNSTQSSRTGEGNACTGKSAGLCRERATCWEHERRRVSVWAPWLLSLSRHGLNLKNKKECVTAWPDANGRKEGPTNPNRNVNRKKINPATMVVWGRQRQFFVYRTPTVTSKLGELFMERHIKRRAEWWEHVAGRTDCK